MALWKSALMGAVILLGGCSYVNNSLLPTLTGEEPSGKSKEQTATKQSSASEPAPVTSRPAAPSQPNTENFQPAPVESGKSTGTAVGQKVAELRKELSEFEGSVASHNNQFQSLHAQIASNAQQYQQLVAQINTKLQIGTTAGNPILINQWNQAQSSFERMDGNVASMNSLAKAAASDSATATHLLESTRATYGLSGAVEEDHRQLASVEDGVKKTVVTLDRLLSELSQDTSRQSLYLAHERSNLTTLSVAIKNGELFGPSLANRDYSTAAPVTSTAPSSRSKTANLAGRRPLVIIRFDRPDVKYEQALYTAVSQALARKPSVDFDLVAVAPRKNSASVMSQSRENADAVMRSLTNMGLPPSRITLSATTSSTVETNEVHLYVR